MAGIKLNIYYLFGRYLFINKVLEEQPPLPIHLSNTLYNAGRSISAATTTSGTCNVTLNPNVVQSSHLKSDNADINVAVQTKFSKP